MATPQIAQQPTKNQINGYLEKTECGHSFKFTAGKKGQKMVTLRRPNVATPQSLLQLTKSQINCYLEKSECCHSTKLTAANKVLKNIHLEKTKCGHSAKCAPGNDGHTAGQVPGQAKERLTGSRQQDPWLLQRVKNLSFVGSGIPLWPKYP